MACKNPDAPCPGCRKPKTGCASDILQDLFDDLMALAPSPSGPAPWRDATGTGTGQLA